MLADGSSPSRRTSPSRWPTERHARCSQNILAPPATLASPATRHFRLTRSECATAACADSAARIRCGCRRRGARAAAGRRRGTAAHHPARPRAPLAPGSAAQLRARRSAGSAGLPLAARAPLRTGCASRWRRRAGDVGGDVRARPGDADRHLPLHQRLLLPRRPCSCGDFLARSVVVGAAGLMCAVRARSRACPSPARSPYAQEVLHHAARRRGPALLPVPRRRCSRRTGWRRRTGALGGGGDNFDQVGITERALVGGAMAQSQAGLAVLT